MMVSYTSCGVAPRMVAVCRMVFIYPSLIIARLIQ